jgi:HTH-type transcriptional regulator/antitoxin HigA
LDIRIQRIVDVIAKLVFLFAHMTLAQIDKIKTAWPSVAGTLHVPHSKKDYDNLVSLLDSLVDEVGENEKHPLASLMEVIGVLIWKYEDEHMPELRS